MCHTKSILTIGNSGLSADLEALRRNMILSCFQTCAHYAFHYLQQKKTQLGTRLLITFIFSPLSPPFLPLSFLFLFLFLPPPPSSLLSLSSLLAEVIEPGVYVVYAGGSQPGDGNASSNVDPYEFLHHCGRCHPSFPVYLCPDPHT